jgi:hypothetical protein
VKERNCFGVSSVEQGHSLLPAPPLRITGTIACDGDAMSIEEQFARLDTGTTASESFSDWNTRPSKFI